MQQKKILLIIPKLYNGGIERVCSNLSCGLNNKFEQCIFSIMNQDKSYSFKEKPIVLDMSLGKNFFGKTTVFFRRLFNIFFLKKKNIISLSFGERCNLLNMLIYRGDIRVLSCHSIISTENHSKGYIGKIYTILAKILYKKAFKIIAVSSEVKDDLITNFNLPPSKVIVISNGYNLTDIHTKSKSEPDINFSNKKINLVTVGRITYAKGILYQLHIVKSILSRDIPCHLYIVGGDEDAEYKSLLIATINKLEISEHITFLGYQENVYKFISKCDIFLLTSIFEGFAGVIIESLCCGTPVLTSDCRGPLDIIKHDPNGVACQYLGKFSGRSEVTDDDFLNISKFVSIITSKTLDEIKIKKDYSEVCRHFSVQNMCEKYERELDI